MAIVKAYKISDSFRYQIGGNKLEVDAVPLRAGFPNIHVTVDIDGEYYGSFDVRLEGMIALEKSLDGVKSDIKKLDIQGYGFLGEDIISNDTEDKKRKFVDVVMKQLLKDKNFEGTMKKYV